MNESKIFMKTINIRGRHAPLPNEPIVPIIIKSTSSLVAKRNYFNYFINQNQLKNELKLKKSKHRI